MIYKFKSVLSIPSMTLCFLIRFYQRCISPALGARCRFYPTCSEYARICLVHQGVLIGGARSVFRLCKCHPWHPGGIDLPFEDNVPSVQTPLQS